MQDIIRTALIGCGGISTLHMRAIEALEDVEIAYFCDTDIQAAGQRAAQYGQGEVVEDYRRVLADPTVRAVHIATPHHLHAGMALEALASGRYVLCEKPMAISIADARAMVAADNGKRLGIVFQNRYNDATIAAKKLLDSGELGTIQGIRASVTWERGADYYALAEWRGRWDQEGGGSLINQAIHTVDLMYYLGGPFAKIKGSISTDVLQGIVEVEDNSHATIQYQNGTMGLLHTSNSFGISPSPEVLIYCEKGLLALQSERLTLMVDDKITLLCDALKAVDGEGKACYGLSHSILIREFYKSIRADAPLFVDAAQGYPAIWAVLGIYASSREDRWIEFA